MSKRPKATRRDETKAGAAPAAQPQCVPLKPRPKLFVALIVGFAIWVGVLLTLYFRTVYPMRYGPAVQAATTRS